jgi:hypothetical protein
MGYPTEEFYILGKKQLSVRGASTKVSEEDVASIFSTEE